MGRKNADTCDIPTNDAENIEVLEEGSRSILMGIIKQFGKDMDLSRVTLPTFVLEPRSMLEKITDFMAHPELAEQAAALSDPTERFVAVVKYFLSGWHIKPKGVKKPYNPVLGEFFRCRYEFKDGSQAYYIAEQVSHHPPVSAYHYANPQHGIIVDGEARPKARFLGNSAATVMCGYSRLTFAKHHNETYEITNPNVYARGILFGKMLMELGDQCTVKCVTSDLVAELDFKTKGMFSSGQYNAVVGKIKKGSTGELLYDISGSWTSELFIKPIKNKVKEPLFTVKGAVIHPKIVEPESAQEENESRRLWSKLTTGLRTNDLDGATEAKTMVENRQRQERQEREKKGHHWTPRFFNLQENGDYEFTHRSKINYASQSDQANQDLKQVIFSKSSTNPSSASAHDDKYEKSSTSNGKSSIEQSVVI